MKERKLSRHAKTMVPKMKTNPKGKGFMKKGLNLSKILIGARRGCKNGVFEYTAPDGTKAKRCYRDDEESSFS